MLNPIPLKALIDTVVHSPLVQSARGDDYTPDSTLENVLVQNKNIRTLVNGSYIMTSGALMFWDATYSSEASFDVGDKIKYTDKATNQDVERYVTDITVAQTHLGLHHLELTLV